MTSALPWVRSTSAAVLASKNEHSVVRPLSLAIFDTLIDGSMPRAFTPSAFSGFSRMPSFDPISTTKRAEASARASPSKCRTSPGLTDDR